MIYTKPTTDYQAAYPLPVHSCEENNTELILRELKLNAVKSPETTVDSIKYS